VREIERERDERERRDYQNSPNSIKRPCLRFVKRAVYFIQRTLNSIKRALNSIPKTLHSIQTTLQSGKRTVSSVSRATGNRVHTTIHIHYSATQTQCNTVQHIATTATQCNNCNTPRNFTTQYTSTTLQHRHSATLLLSQEPHQKSHTKRATPKEPHQKSHTKRATPKEPYLLSQEPYILTEDRRYGGRSTF